MNIKKYNEIADKNKPQKQVKTYSKCFFSGWSDWYDRRIFFKSLQRIIFF